MTFTSTYLRRFQHDLLERSVFPSHKNRVLYFLKLLFLTGLSWLLFVIFSGTAAACVVTSWYPDLDGDSYGSTSSGVTLCEIAPSYTSILSGVNGAIYASAKQSDGKIVIGGDFSSVGGVTRGKLARLNADGTLDTTFPDIGINFQINALAIQSDGKILIGGTFTTVGGFSRTAFARINTDGSVDSLTANTIGGGINAIAIQSDGKILLGGSFTHVNGTARNRIARLNTDGSLDTFAPSISTAGGYVKAIAIQSDGKILVGGSFTTVSALTRRGLVRINTNGTVDTAFVDINVNIVHTIALGTGDSILIGGTFTTMGTSSVYSRSKIGRIKSDGSIDTVFNPSASDIVNFISVDSQERIMVGGAFTTIGGGSRSGIARLTSGGTLDSQFNIATSLLSGYTILSETAGSYLIGGSFGFEGSNLVRVNALGNLYYTGNNQDCSDGNSLINPLTLELNDGIDQNCVNDAPTLSAIANRTINEDTTTGVNYTLTDVDNVLSCTSTTGITYTSTNTTLLPVANITRGGTTPNCSITVSPVANLFGTSNIQILVNDGSLNNAQTFMLTVNSVNDAPTGTGKVIITPMNEDYFFGINDIVANTFPYTDSLDNPVNALSGVKLTSLPTIGSLGYISSVTTGKYIPYFHITVMQWLVYTPPANVSGLNAGSFTYQLQDNGGTANGGVDLDPTPKTVTIHITTFTINSGATATNVTGVQLNNIICPAGSQIAYSHSDNYPTNWTSCSSSLPYSLPAGEGIKYMYMRWKDAQGNESETATRTIILDTTAPTGGSFTVNNNAAATSGLSVTLNTTCATDAGVGGVQVAFGNTANPTNWTTCSASMAHTLLAPDGTKTVFMRFRDSLGNISSDVNDQIVLDTTAPSIPSMTAEPTFTQGLSNGVSSTAATDAGVGGIQYEFCRNTTNSTGGCASSGWGSTTGSTFSSLSNGQIYFYFVRSRDSLSNTSNWSVSTSSTQDNAAPTTTISPNGSGCYLGESITLSCNDSTGAGCSTTQYKVVASATVCDTTGLLTYTGAFAFDNSTTKKVCYRSTDNAGNVQSIQTSSLFGGGATTFYQDSDGDSFGNSTITQIACTAPVGYTGNNTDCVDTDILQKPGQVWWLDADNDNYGSAATGSITQCTRPTNRYVASELTATGSDCNDGSAGVNPGVVETAVNGVDNDCNGLEMCYRDVDNDAYGSTNTTGSAILSCVGTGIANNATDCVDTDALQKPGQFWWTDADGDDVGNGTGVTQCTRPLSGYVTAELTMTGVDCNDTNPLNFPGNPEVCDLQDNDCDTLIDDADPSFVGGGTYYRDLDGDGFGNPSVTINTCGATSGYVANNTDCVDTDAIQKPGQVWYKDADNDAFGDASSSSVTQCLRPVNYKVAAQLTGGINNDCNDASAITYPGATELNDGIDQNCVNDAPTLSAITNRTINEDTTTGVNYTLTDVDNVLSCTSTTGITYTSTNTTLLPVANITRGGTTPNCSITVSPVANLFGTSNIQITVNDGSLNNAQTFMLTVNSVNDAPTGTGSIVFMAQNTTFTFSTGNFVITDSNDAPANSLNRVRISTLPALGSLTLNSGAISVGQYISLADITNGFLRYAPAVNGSGIGYTSFTVQSEDNGGTANGGINLDQTPRTITVDVVNFAIDSGAVATITTNLTLTNITCPAGAQIAFGNSINPTNRQACTPSKSHASTGGDGVKTVYMKWRVGTVESQNLTKTILLDTTAPTGGTFTINFDDPGTNITGVNLGTTCATDGSGVGGVQVAYGTGQFPTNWTSCIGNISIGYSLTTPDGSKTLYIRFRDSLGNVSSAVSDAILLDQTPPTGASMVAEPTYTSGLTNTVTRTNASDGTGIGGITYQFCRNTTNTTASGCVLSSWTGATAITHTGLADGQIYYYFVRARDSLQNTTVWSAVTSSTQDNTAPTGGSFSINNNATGTNTTAVTLNTVCPTDSVSSGVQVAFGTGATPTNWTGCSASSPYTLVTGDGTKTVYMRFRDAVQNTTTVISDSIILDTIAPSGGTFVINNDAEATSGVQVTLNTTCATDAGVGGVEVAYGDANGPTNWTGCTANIPYTLPTGDGGKTVLMRRRDAVGNITALHAADGIYLDTVVPDVPYMINEPSYTTGLQNTVQGNFVGDSGIGPREMQFCINTGNTSIGCTPNQWNVYTLNVFNSMTYTGLIDGQIYYYFVRARDAAGNTSAWSPSTTSTQDNSAPVGGSFVINNNATGTNNQTVTLNITCAVDAGAGGVQVAYGNTTGSTNRSSCFATKSHTLPLGDGDKIVYLRFKDSIGNETSEMMDTIILDMTPPTVSVMNPEPAYTSGLVNTVSSSTSTDALIGGVEYQYCRGPGPSVGGCVLSPRLTTPTFNFVSLNNNTLYYYFVQTRDSLGNASAWSTGTSSRQDNVAPSGTYMLVEPSFTQGTTNTVYASGSFDGGAGNIQYQFCINTGNTTTGCTSTTWSPNTGMTFTGLSNAVTYYYFVRAKDGVENTSNRTASTSSTQDSIAPNTTIIPNGSTCMTGSTSITITCSDTGGAGCLNSEYKVIDAASSCDTSGLTTYTGTFILSGSGLKKICYRATDNVNNVQSIQTSSNYTLSNTVYYQDSDGDGYGNPGVTQIACATPVGYTGDSSDCVDTDALQKPGQVWYKDADGDNYSDANAESIIQCARPVNYKVASELIALNTNPPSLLGLRSFTNNGNDSIGFNNATMNGTVYSSGIISTGITFDSYGDSVTRGFNGFPATMTGITISFWAKTTNIGVDNFLLQTSTLTNNNRMSIHFPWSDNVIYWDFGDALGAGRLSTPWQSAWNNVWSYWTFTSQQGIGQKIYRNGVLITSDGTAGTFTPGSMTSILGGFYGSTSWLGSLDEFRVYSKELSLNEIQDLYQTTSLNSYSGLNDCNDALANTYPGAPELNDGIDQNCVNDAPTINTITSRTINEDASTGVVYAIGDVDNILSCTTSMTQTSTNTTLLPLANISESGTAPTCTITLTPVANQRGTSTVGLTVSDGLLSTGTTFTLTVNNVNDAPTGTDSTFITTLNNTGSLSTGLFILTDTNDSPANSLSGVRIASLPASGTLRINGVAASIGNLVSLAQLNAGQVTYTPANNSSGINISSFTFQIQDNGLTANGGIDLDPTPKTMMLSVTNFSINTGATYVTTTGVILTNIVCPVGTQIAYGTGNTPTNRTACSASVPYTLSVGDGVKTVYMRRQSGGITTTSLAKTIILDTAAPVGGSFVINANATGTNTTGVTLNTICATDAGVGGVQVAYGNTSNPSNWTTCTNTMSHTLTGVDGTKTVYMLFKDSLNNTTTAITDTIILDTVAPTTTIDPNGASCATGSTMVSLSCDDGSGVGCASMQYKIVNNGTTCDSTNLITYTGAFVMNGVGIRKVCYRSLDEATNTEIIQTSANFTVSNTVYYQDSDGDGFGNPGVTQMACGTPVGYTGNNTDCVDTDPKQKPGQIWWKDADNDNYGDELTGAIIQCLRPANYKIATEMTLTGTDCNDTLFAVNPGVTDIVADGIDNNCDGFETCFLDADLDNHGTTATTGTTVLTCIASGVSLLSDDCDDVVSTTYPGAPELCDGLNNDCDLITDEKPDNSICTICERIDLTIPQSECESLRAIYTGSNGSGWNSYNWLTSVDVETWYGVGLLSGHVNTISLSDNGLVGTLGTGLRLPKLTSLDISNNQGLNISSVGQLTGLSFLNIANMNLSALPTSISALQSLDVLYAQNNAITGIVSTLNQLTDLNIIDLSNNLINAIGTQFQNLSQLSVLDLSNNQIAFMPLNALQGVSSLEELDMAGNYLQAIPSSLTGSIATLQRLFFADNDISSLPSPSFFNQFGALRNLNLSGNALNSIGSIGNLSNLTTLDVRGNQLTQLPAGLQALNGLDHLIINDNQITTGLSFIAQITGLQSLYAQNNKFTGLIPQAFDQMSTLSVLSLQNNNLNRENTHMAMSSHLNTTRWNRVGFAKDVSNQGDITAPTMIGTGTTDANYLLYREYTVAWSENSYAVNLTGEGLSFVFSGAGSLCKNLEADRVLTGTDAATISISATTGGNYTGCTIQLRDHANNLSTPITLSNFFLSVNLNDMCDHADLTIPKSECLVLVELFSGTNGMGWTNRSGWFKTANVENRYGIRTTSGAVGDPLRHVDGIFLHKSAGIENHDIPNIDISWNGNRLIGRLPSTLGDLPFLKDLNVAKNTISGQIPSSITQLTGLQQVWMRNNALSGPIPTNWSGLTELKVLDVNVNQLTGTIPSSLGSIQGLLRLDLGSNQLTGTIPTTLGALNNMTALILGNNQLQGTIPAELGNATGLQFLDLKNNRFVGTVPNTFTQLSGVLGTQNKGFYIDGNALNRESTHNALLLGSVSTWFDLITNKGRANQRDITPPVISGTGTVPMTIPTSGVITYTLTVNENSYPVHPTNGGMQSIFGPAGTCSTLSGSRITINTGSTTYTIQPIQAGVYENCTVQIRDHGSNISNTITLPLFTYNLGAASICFDPTLTISSTECLQLSQLYTNTNGSGWSNKTNWFTTGNVDAWFGINLTTNGSPLKKVEEIILHRNDVTDATDRTDPVTSGNNLTGTLTVNWSVFTALKTLRLDNNKIGGVLPVTLGTLTGLETLTVSNNKLIGTLPPQWSGIQQLKTLHIGGNQLAGTIPSSWQSLGQLRALKVNNNQLTAGQFSGIVFNTLQEFDASANLFTGTLPTAIVAWSALQSINLSNNQYTGTLPTSWTALSGLKKIDLSANTLGGPLSDSWSAFSDLTHLSLQNNRFTGTIPLTWSALSNIREINLADNQLGGNIASPVGSWSTVRVLNLSGNRFVGDLPTILTGLTNITNFFVQSNSFSREANHNARISSGLTPWYTAIPVQSKNISNQSDSTPPVLTSNYVILSPVINQQIIYPLTVSEESYYLSTSGSGLTIIATGAANCASMYVFPQEIITGGLQNVQLVPTTDGLHACKLAIRDHGGNRGYHDLTPFIFDMTCGNGLPDDTEECDEGRQCDDGTDCTNDSSICPTQCRPRFVDGCNPSCEPTSCGDGYIDHLGADVTDNTDDDEVCDPGRVCNITNKDCTIDPDLCGPGDGTCVVMENDGCSSMCFPVGCGDGTPDLNGKDNIPNNDDDEECDDANQTNGDGCSATCQVEFCGDGITSVSLGEQCDLGSSNGAVGGVCDSSCQVPTQEQCWELCVDNGNGTGKQSILLLIDRSGSTQGQNRMNNIKTAAHEFVDVLTGKIYSGGQWIRGSQAGIISFASTVTFNLTPTDNFPTVHSTISGLTSSSNSNIAGAITQARTWFTSNAGTEKKVIVLISDGSPTVGGSNNAINNAKAQADLAKSEGIEIFTVGLQISTKGRSLLQYMATTPSHYLEDQSNEILTEIYQSIFGSITCSCEPFEEIDIKCGNGQIDTYSGALAVHNEECDGGMFCDDRNGTTGTSCLGSGGQTLCTAQGKGLCATRQSATCTPTCKVPYCGDGVIDSTVDFEECDDGNQVFGDGCSDICELESCGDGIIQTSLGEQCDDQNNDDLDLCSNTCLLRGCGDGIKQGTEQCDTGRFCDDRNGTTGTDCTANPWICPGDCKPRFRNGCSPTCDAGFCGDGFPDADGINNVIGDSDDEVCDPGRRCASNGIYCGHNPGLCPGECNAKWTPTCTQNCQEPYCGDGQIDRSGPDNNIVTEADNEECDDANSIDTDLCNSSCKLTNITYCPAEYLTECDDGFTSTYMTGQGWFCLKTELTGAIATPMPTFNVKGTLQITGAGATVNVCGTTVTADSNGDFTGSNIAYGTDCSAITATKPGYSCTITQQGPSSLTSEVSNIAGYCTPPLCEWNLGNDSHINCPGSTAIYDSNTNTFTLRADGCYASPMGPVDKQAYGFFEHCGTGTFVARIASYSSTGARGGISVRESIYTGSEMVGMSRNSTSNFVMRSFREIEDSSRLWQQFPSASAYTRKWFKIERTDTPSQISMYDSADGITWALRGAVTITNFNSCLQYGLTVETINVNTDAIVEFDNVSMNGVSNGACYIQ